MVLLHFKISRSVCEFFEYDRGQRDVISFFSVFDVQLLTALFLFVPFFCAVAGWHGKKIVEENELL